MKEVERIADQLRRAFEGDAWHGPAVLEVLAGVPGAQAARRPLAQGHSIWEIVEHIAVWESVVRRRIQGEKIGDLPPEQDWPPVRDTREAAWRETLNKLRRGHQELRQVVAGFPDDRLPETVPGKDYSFYGMLHGVVQHDLYHAGQIVLLKKAVA
ncbi:DinB family protein [Acidobacteriia bacterium AH_259_A11_L15]|nr:DinB family protein [Acidobacteriia bacterium AH_259_A11_L15]